MILPAADPLGWGIRPVLFQIGKLGVDSYTFFMVLGLIVAVMVFYFETKKNQGFTEQAFYILIAALVGGALGAKLPIWIVNYKLILSRPFDLNLLLSGRTISGGIIGGLLAILILKRILGIKIKLGKEIVPALASGIVIGRIGCFLRGCCYGIPTRLPWGVDFGDGITRHPTQLYEGLFCLILLGYLQQQKKTTLPPEQFFLLFLNLYFGFRFLNSFIRANPPLIMSLSGFQLIAVIILTYLNRQLLLKLAKGGRKHGTEGRLSQ